MTSISNSQVINKHMDNYMDIGVAQIDITPESPIRLTGFAARTKSESNSVLQNLQSRIQQTAKRTHFVIFLEWQV